MITNSKFGDLAQWLFKENYFKVISFVNNDFRIVKSHTFYKLSVFDLDMRNNGIAIIEHEALYEAN